MNTILMTSIEVEELQNMIDKAVEKSIISTGILKPKNEIDKLNLLTKKEAIELLKISRPSFDKYCKANRIKSILLGGRVLFDMKDLQSFINSYKTK